MTQSRVYFPDKNAVTLHRDIIVLPQVGEVPSDSNKDTKTKVITLNIDSDTESDCVLNEQFQEDVHTVHFQGESQEMEVENQDDIQENLNPEVIPSSDEDQNEPIGDCENTPTYLRADRRGRQIKTPSWLNDYHVKFYSETESPMTIEEAVGDNDESKWEAAIDKELSTLRKNDTWAEVPWPTNKKVIESKWVFKIKNDNQYKARLVA